MTRFFFIFCRFFFKKWKKTLSWKFTDESSIKYLWIRKWGKWIWPRYLQMWKNNINFWKLTLQFIISVRRKNGIGKTVFGILPNQQFWYSGLYFVSMKKLRLICIWSTITQKCLTIIELENIVHATLKKSYFSTFHLL